VLQREDGYFECMAWEDDKADLVEHNPFAALPFLIDGETVIATAPASSDYLAHKLGLAGGDEVARSRNQQALAVSYELRSDALRVLYAPTEVYEMGHRGHLERTVRMHYAKLDQWLEMHGTAYLSADAPASADFELWEMLDVHELWANDVGCTRPLTSFQHLTKLYESFALLPELQSYFRGPAFDLPLNNKMARFRQTNSSKHDALSAPGTNVQQERVFFGTLIAWDISTHSMARQAKSSRRPPRRSSPSSLNVRRTLGACTKDDAPRRAGGHNVFNSLYLIKRGESMVHQLLASFRCVCASPCP
jgi:glutathione S-transferase